MHHPHAVLALMATCFSACLLDAPGAPASAQNLDARPPKSPLTRQQLLPDLRQFRFNEVLAVNLDAHALRRLRALQFAVLQAEALHALGYTLTRLTVPPGMSSIHHFYPDDPSALHLHIRYRMPPIQDRASEALANSDPCPPDRCYGPSLIGWHSQLSSCARDIRVGLIGNAIDHRHPAFRNAKLHSRSFQQHPPRETPSPHGTAVLALLAGDPASATPGLIPEAEFFVADALSADQSLEPAVEVFDLLRALDWMGQLRADIVMLNFFGPANALLHDAIEVLSKQGIVFVAPAGDEGPDAPPAYPAAYSEVIAVAAVDRNGAPFTYGNRGRYIELAAPGVAVWTAVPGNKHATLSSSLLAVPFATAAIAAAHHSPQHRTKNAVLSRLEYRALGLAAIFGRGLVQAPTKCPRQ